ncbi:MAG: NeuD/PglB/VioB family sugar acetyltransferase [Myxococcaceae bacterium]|nr:NeuD/PglB/VioB family sugar acetyltransferase [Myxococcaceae bacterium]MCI0673071.1 NeuD/PglB/VioB family sugar acetyltransferase [Myxococcaceae bacterium]
MNDLVLFPFNGNAREALAVIDAINRVRPTWKVLGFVDDDPALAGRELYGHRVLGGSRCLNEFPEARVLAVPGRPESYASRDGVIRKLALPPERFATLVHPSAEVGPGSVLGHNTLVMAGVVITVDVVIGNHCVVLPNTVISHDVRVGDFCLIGSNVSFSGGVQVEPQCYIGTGARILQGVTIGTRTLVGLGTVVLGSTAPGCAVVGNPGRVIRNRFLG